MTHLTDDIPLIFFPQILIADKELPPPYIYFLST